MPLFHINIFRCHLTKIIIVDQDRDSCYPFSLGDIKMPFNTIRLLRFVTKVLKLYTSQMSYAVRSTSTIFFFFFSETLYRLHYFVASLATSLKWILSILNFIEAATWPFMNEYVPISCFREVSWIYRIFRVRKQDVMRIFVLRARKS